MGRVSRTGTLIFLSALRHVVQGCNGFIESEQISAGLAALRRSRIGSERERSVAASVGRSRARRGEEERVEVFFLRERRRTRRTHARDARAASPNKIARASKIGACVAVDQQR